MIHTGARVVDEETTTSVITTAFAMIIKEQQCHCSFALTRAGTHKLCVIENYIRCQPVERAALAKIKSTHEYNHVGNILFIPLISQIYFRQHIFFLPCKIYRIAIIKITLNIYIKIFFGSLTLGNCI